MSIKEIWTNFSPESKRKVVLFGSVSVVALLAWGLVSIGTKDAPKTKSQTRPVTHELLTVRDPKSLGIDGLKADIDAMKRQIRDIPNRRDDVNGGSSYPRQSGGDNTGNEYANGTNNGQDGTNGDASPEDIAALERIRATPQKNSNHPKPADTGSSRQPAIEVKANPEPPEEESNLRGSTKRIEIKTIGEDKDQAAPIKVSENTNQPQVETIKGGKKTENARFVLPAGAMMEGVLITGLDTPTSSHAKQQPFPALVRIKHEALLPNRWRTDVRECFVIASGYGDLASERAYLRAEAISCVRDDGSIMEAQIDAFATGEDGKTGIRGRLVSKQGTLIAQSLMGGFIQGVANIYKPARVPQLSLDPSGSSGFARPDAGMAVEEGIAGGVQQAGKAIADFYIDMAKNTFPIIEVDAGRKVTFIVARSANVTTKQALPNTGAGPIGALVSNLQNTPVGRVAGQLMSGQQNQSTNLPYNQ